jgi:2-methylcitrate dehydratase PrpD
MAVTLTPARTLADFASRLQWDDISPSAQERVKTTLLDTLASAFAGHDAAEVGAVEDVARAVFDDGDCTIIGGGTLSPAGATMMNGYLITAVTVCDVHRPTLCHVTPEVIPPALAVAENRTVSGRDFLAAIAAGLEVTTRVGLGLGAEEFRRRGWHSPGVAGPFGGAAAAGRILGLDVQAMTYAFGLAGSQAAGTFAQLGTPAIKFQQARGALGGLMSATLADAGFSAADEVLLNPEGGLFLTHSNGGNPELAIDALATHWELEQISLRPWPVAAYLQTVVSTVLDMTVAHDISPSNVQRVRLEISSGAYRLHGGVPWENRFRARLSPQYVAAVVLHDRRCWLDQFTAERLADTNVTDFAASKVEVIENAALSDIAVTATFEMLNGATLQETREIPHGDAADPLSWSEVVHKFHDASDATLLRSVADEIVRLVEGLEELDSVRPMVRLLGHRAGGSSQ